MGTTTRRSLADIVTASENELLSDWVRHQLEAVTMRRDLIDESDLRTQSSRFLRAFQKALRTGVHQDLQNEAWGDARAVLGELSASRARQGFSSSETATLVLSLK